MRVGGEVVPRVRRPRRGMRRVTCEDGYELFVIPMRVSRCRWKGEQTCGGHCRWRGGKEEGVGEGGRRSRVRREGTT
jgi:hypothetical protein